jgi:hypothetical protein
MTTSQVRGEFGIGVVTKSTEVNDPLHTGTLGRFCEVLGRLPIFFLKISRSRHEMYEVVRRLNAL